MIIIQRDFTITRHSNTSQYSAWITVSENKQETEFIYVFSNLFKIGYFKTNDEVKKFIESIIDGHVAKIIKIQTENNGSLFDFIRYRFIFQTEVSKNNSIGLTGEVSEDAKIASYHFSNLEEAKNFSIH